MLLESFIETAKSGPSYARARILWLIFAATVLPIAIAAIRK
jgi:hypothetical protein